MTLYEQSQIAKNFLDKNLTVSEICFTLKQEGVPKKDWIRLSTQILWASEKYRGKDKILVHIIEEVKEFLSFPKIWIETNASYGWALTLEELKYRFECWNKGSTKKISFKKWLKMLKRSKHSLDKESKLNFGMYLEHSTEFTLYDYLNNKFLLDENS